MSDLISRQAVLDIIKTRLYQTALNNDEYITSYAKVCEDIAENRIDTWINEAKSIEPEKRGDLISRQDVLDLAERGKLVSNGNYKSVCDAINGLPSVEPEKCGDCISREAATDRFDLVQSDDLCMSYDDIIAFLSSLPSVEPEIKTGKWIPIRTKSPQNGQRIFISTIKGTIHDVIWNTDCIHNYARNGCWYKNWFVVAWMPFTLKPYKMEVDG